MRKLYFAIIATMFCMVSCNNNDNEEIIESIITEADKDNHYVDFNQALAQAIAFMRKDSVMTRSHSSFEVANHFEYVANKATRANGEDTIDVRFHVINFTNDGGFALVAADDRTTPVYAYSYEGYLDIEDAIANTGFGVFMDDAVIHYKDDVFDSDMSGGNRLQPSPEYIAWVTNLPTATYNGTTYYCYSYFSTISSKAPMLTTAWNQCDPYNYYCPNCAITGSIYGYRMMAGCGPVAVAQILAYHEVPTVYIDGNGIIQTFPWLTIKSQTSYNVGDYSNNILCVADIISKIHAIAPAHYDLTTGETTTYISDMADVFSYFGYTCSSVYNGYFGVPNCPLQQSLDNDMPIYARGERLSDGQGHAWVIDGYRYEQKFNKYYNMTYPYDYVCTVPSLIYQPYFHCNWGWGGLYNGYVLSYFSPDDTFGNRYSINKNFILNIHP